jgi:PII-like signaling protein
VNGYQLSFFMQQSRSHKGKALHQWLLDLAQSMQIRGATLIAAQEGLGNKHRVHSARFFELADQPIEITMVVSESECEAILQALQAEPDLRLFYSKVPVQFGVIGQADS